ncbi:autotransporter-associated beta strand protein [Martelella mediterranea]|uniref:Autotransporter-associated beta strand protein n=2 Tax=Martelella mediterranea TaxID=293089 RepID=A0A4R3NPT7_9HYPH|nr:autotransporter-associated beta strand protein [Martelella mediterranea]
MRFLTVSACAPKRTTRRRAAILLLTSALIGTSQASALGATTTPPDRENAAGVFSAKAITDALDKAETYGRQSFLASIVENTRLTPERADMISERAIALRPDLAQSITRAVQSGRHLASRYPGKSLAAGTSSITKSSSSGPFPYPGGNPGIPKSQLSEYQRNYSLDAMHADAALEKGFTGKGVVVGVIDTGIAISPNGTVHPEFAGRIDPRSKSYLHWFDTSVEGDHLTPEQFKAAFQQGPDDSYDIDGHGTHVSGIIGAGRNGFGMEGVAPQATILSVGAIPGGDGEVFVDGEDFDIDELQYCGPSILNGSCEPVTGSRVPDTVGFEYLSQFSDVKVINGSFGATAEPNQTTWDMPVDEQPQFMADAKAMRKSLDAGQVIVMSAGNEYDIAPVLAENPFSSGLFPFIQPENQGATNSQGELIYDDHGTGLDLSFTSAEALAAAEAQDGKARGRIVVVVALDAYNQIASYSNRCGVARQWCISAPGGDQPSGADSGIYSTVPEDLVASGYDSYSGTSMAAPNVSGAIAVLTEAYPALTPAEILNVLFLTAEDLGASGVDDVYGWGLVRLDRALSAGPVNMTGNGVYTVGADNADTTWVASFESDGSLEKKGTGTLTVSGAATFRQGIVIDGGLLDADGYLTTPSVMIGQNATLGGSGFIEGDVDVSGRLAPGNSPGTLIVSGDVTLNASATTAIEIDGTGTENGAGNYDRILLSGNGNLFTAGGILNPQLRGITGSAINSFVPQPGALFTFASAPNGSVTGSFDVLVQPASGLPAGTRFDVLYHDTALSLATTPERYGTLETLGIQTGINEKALGRAIDATRPAAGQRPDAAYNDGYNALYAASLGDLESGMSSMTGQIHVEMGTTAVRAVGRFADTIGERQMELAAGWMSANETAYGTGTAWVAGNTVSTDIGASGGLSGYDSTADSGVFGLDWQFSEGVAGIAASYEYADVGAGTNGSGNIDTYQGAVYGTLDAGLMAFSARAGFSYGDLSTSRETSLGSYHATASARGHGTGGFIEASAFRKLDTNVMTLTPSATFGYKGFHRHSMRETGSALGLSLPSETFEETQTTLAMAFSRDIVFDNGLRLEPLLSLGWRHDYGDVSRSSESGIFGGNFEVNGADIGADAFVGRIAMAARANNRFSFEAAYEGEFRENLQSHVFSARASLSF